MTLTEFFQNNKQSRRLNQNVLLVKSFAMGVASRNISFRGRAPHVFGQKPAPGVLGPTDKTDCSLMTERPNIVRYAFKGMEYILPIDHVDVGEELLINDVSRAVILLNPYTAKLDVEYNYSEDEAFYATKRTLRKLFER